MTKKTILVTGGAGYIGSHMCAVLGNLGYQMVVLDNFSNSHRSVVGRITHLTGTSPALVEGDVRDAKVLDKLFSMHRIDAVIHFAGLKAVGESVIEPIRYYSHNVAGTVGLILKMQQFNVRELVFSSSATVYGDQQSMPISEKAPAAATNPYGRSKLMVENMLSDLAKADPAWKIACLRYFNPVGAHESGLLGEIPRGVPHNLMPYIVQVAAGQRPVLKIFGSDYPTVDGTGVRDYIHVMDLVEGHVAALRYIAKNAGALVANLGTGRGVSVTEMVSTFERATGQKVPVEFAPRRPGDIAQCYADPSLANVLLSWKACRSLDEVCTSAWRAAKNQVSM